MSFIMNFVIGLLAFLNVLSCSASYMQRTSMPKKELTFEEKVKMQTEMRNWFAAQIKEFVNKEYNSSISTNAEKAIKQVYDAIGDDFDSLLIFMANAIVNTNGFRSYTSGNEAEDKWIKRGLLAIEGKKNYILLQKLTGDYDWVTNPEYLSAPTTKAVMATIMYYNSKLENKSIDFTTVMSALYPDQVPQPNCPLLRPTSVFAETLRIYKQIAEFFRTCPVLRDPRLRCH